MMPTGGEITNYNSDLFGWNLAEWLERQTANAKVATVLGLILASIDTVESEGWQMKKVLSTNQKKSPWKKELLAGAPEP